MIAFTSATQLIIATAFASAAISWSSRAYSTDDLTGLAHVIDGDTVTIGTTHIRLEGIDAPEMDQVCLNIKGERWSRGIASRDQLSSHIDGRTISCAARGQDRYSRTLAGCSVSGENLNAWMVREGWALAYLQYSREYVADEGAARKERKGMWAGAFIAPWDWRHRNERTAILGALSVPLTSQAELMAPASAATSTSPECIIKGNVNRQGERTITFRVRRLIQLSIWPTRASVGFALRKMHRQQAGDPRSGEPTRPRKM
jgi:endonuclease YncB( thermonuclease family)